MILCRKQGLALRGHRDDGIDLIEEEDDKVSENYGNFLELVHFRAETDAALRKHLKLTCPEECALYIKNHPKRTDKSHR